jgi:hypothetical protein
MKKLPFFIALFLGLFILGCNEVQLTALQRKLLESKDLQGNYQDAYKATLQVLQDYEYGITNTDYASGVIHGATGTKKDFWGYMRWFEATATLEQFGDNTVKERLTILAKKKFSSQYGTQEESKVVEDPELFSKMYDDIQKEIFIRQNINK